jgi:hypothetical protein
MLSEFSTTLRLLKPELVSCDSEAEKRCSCSSQKVVDFQWSRDPSLPWTVLSVSDDAADEQIGGGSMQLWRINHLIYHDEDTVVAELEKHR